MESVRRFKDLTEMKKSAVVKHQTKAEGKFIFPRASRLLTDVDDAGFARLCECMHVRELHLKNKETFIRETDPCNRIGIVVIGAVQLSRQRLDGGCTVLETVREGGAFGMTYVFRGAKTMGISIRAVGDAVVQLFDTESVLHPCHNVCDAHLHFLHNLLSVMSQTTFQLKQKLRILSQRTIRGRLMLYLQILAKRAQSKEFDVPFDRQSLADFLCVDRSALSAELSKLRRERKVECVKNHFKLIW